MTAVLTTFEGGGAAGDALTTANSGLTSVNGASSGNTAVLSAGAAAHGAFGGMFTTSSSTPNGCFGTKNFPTGNSRIFTSSAVFTLPSSAPSVSFSPARFRNTTGDFFTLTWSPSDAKFYLIDAGGTYYPIATAAQITWGQQYRLQAYGTIGTTTSNGELNGKLYRQSTGAQVGSTVRSTAANLGTANAYKVYVGVTTTVPSLSVGVDDVQLDDGTQTPIGDYAAPSTAVPVVDAGPDQTAVTGATVSLSGTASISSGSITSRQWTAVSWPGSSAPAISSATSSSASFVAATSGTYVFRFSATNAAGTTVSDTTSVVAAAASAPVVGGGFAGTTGVIDARASTGSNPLSYSITPSSGTEQPVPGLFLVPLTATNYTVRATDSVTNAFTEQVFNTPATLTARTYTGVPLDFTPPTPLDPATNGVWAEQVNNIFQQLKAKADDLDDWLIGASTPS